jgi:hypothetical protein
MLVLFSAETGGHSSNLNGGAGYDVLFAEHYNGTKTMTGGGGAATFSFLNYSISPIPTSGAASTIQDYVFSEKMCSTSRRFLRTCMDPATATWLTCG